MSSRVLQTAFLMTQAYDRYITRRQIGKILGVLYKKYRDRDESLLIMELFVVTTKSNDNVGKVLWTIWKRVTENLRLEKNWFNTFLLLTF